MSKLQLTMSYASCDKTFLLIQFISIPILSNNSFVSLISDSFLIIISFNKPEKAQEVYKTRWQIEMCFKAMKSSGFDIEKTHLQNIERIQKLILFIMIAFVRCYKTGIYLHQIKPIAVSYTHLPSPRDRQKSRMPSSA